MMKKRKKKEEFEKKVENILYRIEQERISQPNSTVMARMMASNLRSGKINVKFIVQINDDSFYCKQVKLFHSVGAREFSEAIMDRIEDNKFGIILANIPIDTTVLYYIEMLDKGGVWIKRLKDDEKQEPFEFSTTREGVKEISDWDDPNLIRCRICDYMCHPEWDICPGCKTPLYDNMLQQEIFQEDQEEKERKRADQKDPQRIAWENMASVFYEPLPECPNCGAAYQPDWNKCPICDYDLENLAEEKTIKKKKENKKKHKNQDRDII
ncbi:MAG: hypothetical protein GF364_06775 [Candidatus Lokiarchaeota archaeon]|nr:hypothetical protein [Candidatus Lokiarchaeota archaeon]